jgi:hypothetical protein
MERSPAIVFFSDLEYSHKPCLGSSISAKIILETSRKAIGKFLDLTGEHVQ